MKYTIFVVLCLISCQMNPSNNTENSSKVFDVEGHRGCRGLMPENTIPAFLKAMELGVTTLEMDLIISEDKKVVVSHEPYFRSGISLDPQGNPILEEDQLKHNMYKMPYDSIRMYDVGTLPDKNHPDRVNIKAYRPLFSEVVEEIKSFCQRNSTPLPDFNIEIKRLPEYDGIYHPSGEEFADLVLREVALAGIESNTIIQSFDIESLQIVKEKAPNIRIALLIENTDLPQQNLNKLGFTPDIYSCYYKLVNQELIDLCGKGNILVIPWTVNAEEDIRAMIKIGVDGIISDYPDRVIEILSTYADH